MRIAGIIITSMGALGLLSLCADGDFYNGIIGGGIMIAIGIIMIVKGKSRAEVKELKAKKEQQRAEAKAKAQQEREQALKIKQEQKSAKQQQQAEIKAKARQAKEEEKAKKRQAAELRKQQAEKAAREKRETARHNSENFYNDSPFLNDQYYGYDKAYIDAMDKYFKTMETVQTNASILYNLGITDGKKMDELIKLCYQNIDEFKLACNHWKRYGETAPPSAPAYERLAIIYERQEKYDKAIKICIDAIKAGLAEDKYKKRLARLLKKSNTENLEKYSDLLL